MSARNTEPATIWEALRRLLQCNRQQLAARLGISARTLHRYEAATEAGENPGPAAQAKAARLLIETLKAAGRSDHLARLEISTLDAMEGRQ